MDPIKSTLVVCYNCGSVGMDNHEQWRKAWRHGKWNSETRNIDGCEYQNFCYHCIRANLTPPLEMDLLEEGCYVCEEEKKDPSLPRRT